MDLRGRRVVVTGATGFLGRRVVERLRALGATVDGCARSLPDGDRTVQVDVADPYSVMKALSPERPAFAVVHAAALVGDQGRPADYERANVLGVRNVARAAGDAGVRRFVHVSSVATMGFAPGRDADETRPIEEQGDPYGDSKVRGEREALSHHGRQGMEVVVVRPGDILGPASEQWVVRPVQLMRARRFLFVAGGRGHLSPVHVDDVAAGVVAAVTAEGVGGRIYILTDGGGGTTCRQYFTRLAAAAGVPLSALALPRPLALVLATAVAAAARLVGRPPPFTPSAVRYLSRPDHSYSIAAARRDLGYAPAHDLDKGMEELAEWFASERS